MAAKWPNEKLVRTRVVSGFVFLRLICPAILNPRQFGLLTGERGGGARSLISGGDGMGKPKIVGQIKT